MLAISQAAQPNLYAAEAVALVEVALAVLDVTFQTDPV
jgi:hypothetical protein